MPPQQNYPAPPPQPPVQPQPTPPQQPAGPVYAYQEQAAQKKPLFGGGMSNKPKLILMIAGIFIIVMLLLAGVLALTDSSNGRADVAKVVAGQQEIVRVTDIAHRANQGSQKVRSLIVNAQYTSTTNVAQLNTSMDSAFNKGPTATELSAATNSDYDSRITASIQSNNFDQEVARIIGGLLSENNTAITEATAIVGNDQLKAYLGAIKNSNDLLLKSVEAI